MAEFKLLRAIPHDAPMAAIRPDVNYPDPRHPKIEKLGNLHLEMLASE